MGGHADDCAAASRTEPGGGAYGDGVDGRPGGGVADGGLAAVRTAMGSTGMAWRLAAACAVGSRGDCFVWGKKRFVFIGCPEAV
jgi:hypothetical protein